LCEIKDTFPSSDGDSLFQGSLNQNKTLGDLIESGLESRKADIRFAFMTIKADI
jgi:hypothetical protein